MTCSDKEHRDQWAQIHARFMAADLTLRVLLVAVTGSDKGNRDFFERVLTSAQAGDLALDDIDAFDEGQREAYFATLKEYRHLATIT